MAKQEGQTIDGKLYLQLADLYHFHKNYRAEVAILKRFSQLENALAEELGDVFERIERSTSLLKFSVEAKAESRPLSLVPDADEKQAVSIGSSKDIVPRIQTGKLPFDQSTLKVVCVSAAYTGTTDLDEIIQVALVLFEYSPQRLKKGQTLATYWGKRTPKAAIPKKVANQFNFSSSEKLVEPFSWEAAMEIFTQADFVVSHNDAEIERKLLATLLPDIVDIPWHSSERDIPWRAMGFENNRLTQLAGQLDEKVPRTCIDRAMAICRILQKNEPFSTQTYLERLYNMQPMKAFSWTPELLKQAERINNPSARMNYWIVSGLLLLVLGAALGYFYFAGEL